MSQVVNSPVHSLIILPQFEILQSFLFLLSLRQTLGLLRPNHQFTYGKPTLSLRQRVGGIRGYLRFFPKKVWPCSFLCVYLHRKTNKHTWQHFKAFALWKTFPIFREYISSTTTSPSATSSRSRSLRSRCPNWKGRGACTGDGVCPLSVTAPTLPLYQLFYVVFAKIRNFISISEIK